MLNRSRADEVAGPRQGWSFIGAIDPSLRARYAPTMFVLRGLFWLILFIVLAFCFVVLFEYGPRQFGTGCQKEFGRLKSFVVKETGKIEEPKKRH